MAKPQAMQCRNALWMPYPQGVYFNTMQTYKFIREGKEENVNVEPWAWGVVYRDGSEFKQFGDDGVFHQFQEIKQGEVAMFVMHETKEEGARRFDLMVNEDHQIFHFYRNMILAAGSPDEKRLKLYVFGWKNKKTGDCAYYYITPTGHIVSSGSHDSVEVSRIVEALEANKE